MLPRSGSAMSRNYMCPSYRPDVTRTCTVVSLAGWRVSVPAILRQELVPRRIQSHRARCPLLDCRVKGSRKPSMPIRYIGYRRARKSGEGHNGQRYAARAWLERLAASRPGLLTLDRLDGRSGPQRLLEPQRRCPHRVVVDSAHDPVSASLIESWRLEQVREEYDLVTAASNSFVLGHSQEAMADALSVVLLINPKPVQLPCTARGRTAAPT
jgi:hypothetical protein